MYLMYGFIYYFHNILMEVCVVFDYNTLNIDMTMINTKLSENKNTVIAFVSSNQCSILFAI